MKQTVFYLEPASDAAACAARNGGLGAIRDIRARNVKIYFGLWLGLFAFSIVWALSEFMLSGSAGSSELIWAQLVVLAAAVLFYLGSKPLRHHSPRWRMASMPVTVSLLALAGSLTGVVGYHGADAFKAEPAGLFWYTIQGSDAIVALDTHKPRDATTAVPVQLIFDVSGARTGA